VEPLLQALLFPNPPLATVDTKTQGGECPLRVPFPLGEIFVTNSQRLAVVRRCLDRWVYVQTNGEELEMKESVLIRANHYVGRRFHVGTYQAVWFMEEDQLKIQDAEGTLLARLDSAAIDSYADQAATQVAAMADRPATILTMPAPQEALRRAA